MKTASQLLVLALVGAVCSAHAAPSGPSAKMAARLKKRPTSNWLAHYLPDDRYKIAGGVWKYVSTDLDTYYHRPNSPYMLRQPASRVIGFASAAEAEEAGYQPDAGVFSSDPLNVNQPARLTRVGGQRVVLSDRASSIVLPSGWRRGGGNVQNTQYGVLTMDQIFDPKNQMHMIGTFTVPESMNVDFGQFMNIDYMKSLEKNLGTMMKQVDSLIASTGRVNSRTSISNAAAQFNRAKNEQRMFGIRLNGLRGVGTSSRVIRTGQPSRTYSFGRGRKMWSVSDFSRGKSTLTPVIKTLQLR